MAKIAVLGYGVVGSGTVEVFYKNKESLEKKAGQEMDIKMSVISTTAPTRINSSRISMLSSMTLRSQL